MAALLIAYILVADARSSRLALSQNPHGQIAQSFLNEPLISDWHCIALSIDCRKFVVDNSITLECRVGQGLFFLNDRAG